MSIKSTQDISRETAIERITKIYGYVLAKDYKKIEDLSFESYCSVEKFVDYNEDIDITSIQKFTDTMLEDIMGQPFYRFSMFDNYLVVNE